MAEGSARRGVARRFRAWRLAAVGLASMLLGGCGGADPDRAALCERLIGAFDDGPVAVIDRAVEGEARGTVRIAYQARAEQHWIACRFAGSSLSRERLRLESVATDRTGTLSDTAFVMLELWRRLGRSAVIGDGVVPEGGGAAAEPSPMVPLLYFAQQLVNAVTIACVYGLLAVGYTMVYGIIGRINFAFGEMYTIGAFVAVAALVLATAGVGAPLALAVVIVVVLAMAFTASYGWATDRLVFRPLRAAGSQAPMIAAIGLSIALQEAIRLLQGANERWPQPILSIPITIAQVEGFSVVVKPAHLGVIVLTIAVQASLIRLLKASAFGRAQRACADDIRMAALLGVDTDRTIALTFLLGAAWAGIAGAIIALDYGGVDFFMGFRIGFKALTAAIVGGIGSVPGAMLGGVLIGVLETLWSAYLRPEYRDIAVFVALALCLIFRPAGLLGQASGRGD